MGQFIGARWGLAKSDLRKTPILSMQTGNCVRSTSKGNAEHGEAADKKETQHEVV